jgi:hypothetical protein
MMEELLGGGRKGLGRLGKVRTTAREQGEGEVDVNL